MSEKGKVTQPPRGGAMSNLNLTIDGTSPPQAEGEHSLMRRIFSGLKVEWKSEEQKMEERIVKRWGSPRTPHYEIVMRYWLATRMRQHWEDLRTHDPKTFKYYMEEGYMEPIPTSWVKSGYLASRCSRWSYWETRAEERLYYLLNNGATPDGTIHRTLTPLHIEEDQWAIIARGNERNARQVPLDAQELANYQSPGDVFLSDKEIKCRDYSAQVPHTVYAARQAALHELTEGIQNGTDHLETMLLIDVSGSMTWNPHHGILGPDKLTRYHDQPSNIRLVENLVHRVLQHMIPRAQKEHRDQKGIDTVTFASNGRYIGRLSASDFRNEWANKVHLGGGTQVMRGWQVVKQTYFDHQQRNYGHGRFDPKFGWQATPGMPKLSLLVFLDGEANDMDEFELELLGETWAYVTIALVGMENCPHHHSHAVELERVAQFNPHVGFYDVHGRVCERMVVEDLLSSVYPVDPPQYSEIVDFDLPEKSPK